MDGDGIDCGRISSDMIGVCTQGNIHASQAQFALLPWHPTKKIGYYFMVPIPLWTGVLRRFFDERRD
jgi:hypothetical protein